MLAKYVAVVFAFAALAQATPAPYSRYGSRGGNDSNYGRSYGSRGYSPRRHRRRYSSYGSDYGSDYDSDYRSYRSHHHGSPDRRRHYRRRSHSRDHKSGNELEIEAQPNGASTGELRTFGAADNSTIPREVVPSNHGFPASVEEEMVARAQSVDLNVGVPILSGIRSWGHASSIGMMASADSENHDVMPVPGVPDVPDAPAPSPGSADEPAIAGPPGAGPPANPMGSADSGPREDHENTEDPAAANPSLNMTGIAKPPSGLWELLVPVGNEQLHP